MCGALTEFSVVLYLSNGKTCFLSCADFMGKQLSQDEGRNYETPNFSTDDVIFMRGKKEIVLRNGTASILFCVYCKQSCI